ncbi:MAG: DUF779 domain-containing protein [Actinophytocola sp.]|nr:DUF779 domain-containing protein [Actinophytocola sp.]
MTAERVAVTPEAADLLRSLADTHGPLMFHQSGGCCDGSAPMCYPAGEFRTGNSDEGISISMQYLRQDRCPCRSNRCRRD